MLTPIRIISSINFALTHGEKGEKIYFYHGLRMHFTFFHHLSVQNWCLIDVGHILVGDDPGYVNTAKMLDSFPSAFSRDNLIPPHPPKNIYTISTISVIHGRVRGWHGLRHCKCDRFTRSPFRLMVGLASHPSTRLMTHRKNLFPYGY